MCHCSMCRRQTGLYYAATAANNSDLEILTDDTLRWYESSAWAKRGFCRTCGSALFWKANDEDETSILAGSLVGDSGLKIGKQIFTKHKGDFYDLIAGIPTFDEGG